jgi:iron complex outermembrane receptor protein
MRFLYLLFSVVLLSFSVASPQVHAQQGSIAGTVRAGDTGESLPGANVSLVEVTRGTSTDAEGAFRLEGVPAGTYTLRVSFVGYSAAERDVDVSPNQTTTINVRLALSSEQFEEMVVTGSREEERRAEAPVQIEVIGSEDIKTAGGETFWSSTAGLKGVDFSRVGLNQQSISMRGFDTHYGSRLVQMKNGRLAQIPGVGIPQVNYVPTSRLDVRQMEVVVGPASALYGPNAHAGVINVLTKTPWDESGGALSVRGGDRDFLDVTGRAAGTIGEDFGWKVTGQYMRGNDYRPPTGGPNARSADSTHFFNTQFNERELVDGYDIRSLRGQASLYYRFAERWQVKGSYGYSVNDNFETTTFGRLRTRDFRLQYQNLELTSDHWTLRGTHTSNDAGNSYSIDLLARSARQSFIETRQSGTSPEAARQEALSQVPSLRDSSLWALEGDLWDGEVRYNNSFGVGGGSVSFQTGIQVRRYAPTSNRTFLADAIGRDLGVTEAGAFLQVDYRPTDALRLNTAARVDERAGERAFSPKASLVYSATDDHIFRLTYNRAFKFPETIQRHYYAGVIRGNNSGFVVRDGPTLSADVVRRIDPLEPEEVNSIELGYRGQFGDRLSANIVGFTSWYSNFVSPLTFVASPDPSLVEGAAGPTFAFQNGGLIEGGTLLTFFNYGEAVVRGLDLGLTYAAGEKLTLTGTLSLIDRARFDKGTAAESLLLNVPRAKVKGGIKVRDVGFEGYFLNFTGRWKAAHRFRAGYWDSAQFYDDGEIPSRFSANLIVGYTVPGTGLSLKGSATNLLDTTVPDKLGAPRTGRLLILSATYTFLNE